MVRWRIKLNDYKYEDFEYSNEIYNVCGIEYMLYVLWHTYNMSRFYVM